LLVFNSHALTQDNELRKYLGDNPDACQFETKSNGQWPEIRFFEGESLDAMLGHDDGLLSKLVDAILREPPHELKWMQAHPYKHEIKKSIVGTAYNPTLEQYFHEKSHLSDLLALRGLISGGVLRHCLVKRHRVNYGVARPGKKRLAVPFKAADTPDLRSEFAHPDCAIGFTSLSYYFDGLSKDELKHALQVMMKLGENAQRNFYSRWFQISSDQRKKDVDTVEKIDLTNDVQFQKLYEIYSKNMAAVDFYLNYCVFPVETDQFDSR
jgi:hypothetical protein